MSEQDDAGEITQLLAQWRTGGAGVGDKLFELVFENLRRIAANQFRGERPNHTLQPTAVVNEAWMKLVGQQAHFNDRAHFFAIAAQAMRRILVDHARARRAQKRDAPEWLEEPSSGAPNIDVLALDDALQKLVALDQDQARIVELKYFAGLTNEEAAEVLGVSVATVKRSWQSARAFLFRELEAP
jgi:RNA polymerase sigma factor (TIGR02999 family)